MDIIRHSDNLPEAVRGGSVTIGNFDGVHLGHAQIIRRLVAKAVEAGGPPVVFTFEPHPVRLLRPESAPHPLTWTDRKAALLAELGVGALVAYPTDRSLLQLEPSDFFADIVVRWLGARSMVEGPNFHFGRDRKGDVQTLSQLASAAGVDLEIVDPVEREGQIVSSSRVRQLLAEGQLDTVTRLLTQPYRIRGMVTHGAGRGKSIGFPTANLEAVDTLLPAEGVYAGRAYVSGRSWPAAINIGPNPTFGEAALKVEVHLAGFDDSLYSLPVEVDFLARLRDIHPFSDVEQLKQQLAADVERTQSIFEKSKPVNSGNL
ncbi:MAG: bifunctional riboflavin kinase/FAD synthetase [Planctomycetales bacterium]